MSSLNHREIGARVRNAALNDGVTHVEINHQIYEIRTRKLTPRENADRINRLIVNAHPFYSEARASVSLDNDEREGTRCAEELVESGEEG